MNPNPNPHLILTSTTPTQPPRPPNQALTRRQYGYASVDDYYAAASSDQRLPLITTPLLLLNAYDDPIVPGASLCGALAH